MKLDKIRTLLVNVIGLCVSLSQSKGELGPDEDTILLSAQEIEHDCRQIVEEMDQFESN